MCHYGEKFVNAENEHELKKFRCYLTEYKNEVLKDKAFFVFRRGHPCIFLKYTAEIIDIFIS